LTQHVPPEGTIALGEPGEGLPGWRLSHRQALAALPVACREDRRIVRYAEVALLAAVCHDDLLATSLRRLYLEPLEAAPDRGAAVRATLRAYFEADRNISSAAAILEVNRHTVASRLRAFETITGCSVDSHAPALEIALRLECLASPA